MKIAMYRAMEANVDFEHCGLINSFIVESVRGAGFGDSITGLIRTPYSFNETLHWGSNTAEQALDGWKNSPGHNDCVLNKDTHAYEQQYAIGVGFVNQTAVACFFSKEETATIATDSRSLSDYVTTEVVPLLKSRYEAGVNENGYGIPNETWACIVVDPKTGQSVDENNKEEKKEKKASSESKTVKATKISGVKVSRKKAGKYTKLTVKFSKVKKVKGIKYQVQVAKNKKFKSAKKATTSSTKKTFSINYKGKKAYIRVRCYKKINGKTVYGKWSSIKTIKTYK